MDDRNDNYYERYKVLTDLLRPGVIYLMIVSNIITALLMSLFFGLAVYL